MSPLHPPPEGPNTSNRTSKFLAELNTSPKHVTFDDVSGASALHHTAPQTRHDPPTNPTARNQLLGRTALVTNWTISGDGSRPRPGPHDSVPGRLIPAGAGQKHSNTGTYTYKSQPAHPLRRGRSNHSSRRKWKVES